MTSPCSMPGIQMLMFGVGLTTARPRATPRAWRSGTEKGEIYRLGCDGIVVHVCGLKQTCRRHSKHFAGRVRLHAYATLCEGCCADVYCRV